MKCMKRSLDRSGFVPLLRPFPRQHRTIRLLHLSVNFSLISALFLAIHLYSNKKMPLSEPVLLKNGFWRIMRCCRCPGLVRAGVLWYNENDTVKGSAGPEEATGKPGTRPNRSSPARREIR